MQPTATEFEPLLNVAGLKVLASCDNYTPSSSGGAEKAAHEIYVRLGAAGVRLLVVGVPLGEPYADPGVEVVAARGIDLSRLVGGYLGVSPDTFRMANRSASTFEPHVLHANTIHYNGSIALARLAAKRKIPLVLTAQVGPLNEMPFVTRTCANLYDWSVGRYIVRRASKVLAVSESVRDHMCDLGARPEDVTVVENGVDHDRFRCSPLELRSAADCSEPLVLSIGRLIENKGPQLLVDAAIRLHDSGRPVRVDFLGDGPLRASLASAVERAGLSHRITFRGQVPDVEHWIAQADIVVRPSFTEGLPLAVLEAMSAGRLNVVSDIRPNRELITDRVNGLTFRTGDSADLAEVLWHAVSDESLRVTLAATGRITSTTRSWDRMAAETGAALVEASRLVSRR